MNDPDYYRLSEAVFACVERHVDEWLNSDMVDIDTQRSGGLLELAFKNGHKIVVNTQPPLQEMWLAARSGGFHFRYANGRWFDTKGQREFFETLSDLASIEAEKRLDFRPELT